MTVWADLNQENIAMEAKLSMNTMISEVRQK